MLVEEQTQGRPPTTARGCGSRLRQGNVRLESTHPEETIEIAEHELQTTQKP